MCISSPTRGRTRDSSLGSCGVLDPWVIRGVPKRYKEELHIFFQMPKVFRTRKKIPDKKSLLFFSFFIFHFFEVRVNYNIPSVSGVQLIKKDRCSIHHSMTNHCQDTEITQVPINRQLDKEDVVCKYNWISLSLEKDAHPLRGNCPNQLPVNSGRGQRKREGRGEEREGSWGLGFLFSLEEGIAIHSSILTWRIPY